MILTFFRWILVYFCLAFLFGLGSIAGIFRPFSPHILEIFGQIFHFLSKKIMGFSFIIRNEHLLKDNPPFPCLFISNHQSNFDLVIFCYFLRYRLVAVGKKTLLYLPFFGTFFWLSGNILIDRDNKKKAKKGLDKIIAFLNNSLHQQSVWMMPEGTRRKTKGLGPFKMGAFLTSIQSKRPIIAVCTSYYHLGIDFSKKKSGKVIVSVLGPFHPPTVDKNISYDELKQQAAIFMEEIHHKMKEEILSLNLQLTQK